MDPAIDLGEGAVKIPGKGKTAVFVVFEALEFLDEVELEFNRHPGGELEGDVFVGIGATEADTSRIIIEELPMSGTFLFECGYSSGVGAFIFEHAQRHPNS